MNKMPLVEHGLTVAVVANLSEHWINHGTYVILSMKISNNHLHKMANFGRSYIKID